MMSMTFNAGVMKNVYSTLIACACITMLFSCAKEIDSNTDVNNEVAPAKEAHIFSLGAANNEGDADTKTILSSDANGIFSAWESGDNLFYKINTKNHSFSAVTIGEPCTFSITDDLAKNDVIYAWFPYCVDETGTPDGVWFNVPADQHQSTNFDLDAMPMVAKPVTMTAAMVTAWDSDKTAALADVQFANLGSVINFKVYNTNSAYNSEKLTSISFDAGSSVISGTFALDLTAIDFTDEAQVTYTESKLVDDAEIPVGYEDELGRHSVVTTTLLSNSSIPTSKASALDVYMVVLPGTYAGTITVTTTKARYIYPLSSREFKRSDIKKLGLDLNSGNATREDYVKLNWASPTTGKNALNAVIGVSSTGIGTDYAEVNAPYRLKFDNSNDNIIIKTDKAIGKVAIDYKKIAGNGNSTFTVQESADGESFSDVETVTATGAQEATGTMETSNVFSDDCRYVKLNFTKVSNLAVGEIRITQLDPSTKRITVQSNLAVPVSGAADATLSYTAQNFEDDITVSKTGCVTSASKTATGTVTYSVAANYAATNASGTIVLTSTAYPAITRTINVTQPASSLTTSASPSLIVTIPNDENTASFTITTPEFDWNASAVKDNEDVNLQIKTGESTYAASHSGSANAEAQTITVYSTTAAAASTTTLGTVTIYRTASAGDDPQAIVVTIKKAGTTAPATKEYTLTITVSDFNTDSYNANNNEKTTNAIASDSSTFEVKWTSNQVMKYGDNMQWKKNEGYIYNSTDLGTIKSVTVNSSTGSFTTYYGTEQQPSSGTAGTGKGYFKTSVGNATGTTTSVVIVFER